MTPTSPATAWRPLRTFDRERLRVARVALRHALQVPAASHVGRFAARADQSHTSFGWREDRLVSSGDPTVPWVAALDPVALVVELPATDRGGSDRVASRLELEGRSLEEAHAAWQALLDAHLGEASDRRLAVALPDHPAAFGAPFVRDVPALTALLPAWDVTELAGDDQAACVRAFLEAAYDASTALLAPRGA